jgi:hypothetical protein
LPGHGDGDVDAERAGEDGGGQVGGELEQRGGAVSGGLESDWRSRSVSAYGLIGRPGCPPGNSHGEVPGSPTAAFPRRFATTVRASAATGSGSTTGSAPRRIRTCPPLVRVWQRPRAVGAPLGQQSSSTLGAGEREAPLGCGIFKVQVV